MLVAADSLRRSSPTILDQSGTFLAPWSNFPGIPPRETFWLPSTSSNSACAAAAASTVAVTGGRQAPATTAESYEGPLPSEAVEVQVITQCPQHAAVTKAPEQTSGTAGHRCSTPDTTADGAVQHVTHQISPAFGDSSSHCCSCDKNNNMTIAMWILFAVGVSFWFLPCWWIGVALGWSLRREDSSCLSYALHRRELTVCQQRAWRGNLAMSIIGTVVQVAIMVHQGCVLFHGINSNPE